MEIPLQKRLSWRQARLTVLVALGLGVAFGAVEFGFDLRREIARMEEDVRRTLELSSAGAAAAVKNTDRATARMVTQRLVRTPPYHIFRAEIVDDFGVQLATSQRHQAPSRMGFVVDRTFGPSRTYTYQLFASGGGVPTRVSEDALDSSALPSGAGQIRVAVDHHVVFSNFAGRWMIQLVSEGSRMMLLAAALVLVFHRLVTRPLGRMAWHYSSINLDEPGDCRYPLPPDHREDELGLLGDAVNHALERLAGNIENQRQSYFHLRQEIEERQRSASAAQHQDNNGRRDQRWESAARLAAGTADGLHRHLSTIQDLAQRVRQGAASDGSLAHDTERILRACDEAGTLAEDLHALAAPSPAPAAPLALNAWLHERLPALRAATPAVEIRLDPATGLWRPLIDPARLEKALAGLLASAAEASAGGGIVTLSTANVEFPESLGGPPAGRWAALRVHDTGPVIPPHLLDRVFEPYATLRGPDRPAEGLRLAIAYGVARASGGHGMASSSPSRGTCLELLLPVAGRDIDAAPPAPHAQDARTTA